MAKKRIRPSKAKAAASKKASPVKKTGQAGKVMGKRVKSKKVEGRKIKGKDMEAVATRPSTKRPSALVDTRIIYCGDCLDPLRKLPNACIDLIYIDPPFNSNRNYEVFWGETKEKRAFEDRHESTRAYIDYMRPRCVELARVLKKTGSFYYHCDWHAGHYIKVMLDQILGENCFQNMIVWKRSHAHSDTRQGMSQFGRVCDYLFFYTGGKNWTWNPIHTKYDAAYLESEYRHVDVHGRRYKETDVTAAKPGGDTRYEWRVKRSRRPNAEWIPDFDDEWRRPLHDVEYRAVKPYDRRYWAYSKDNLIEFWNSGRLTHRSTGMPRLMQFADDMPGVALQDLWSDIPPISALAAERLGFPTQKPIALLERIINASSNPNDIILDAFCGCGTALVAAQNLGRRWIGIDISPTACRVMAKRLKDVCKLREDEALWRAGRGFVVRDLPRSEEQLHKIPPFEFESWAVIALGGIPNKTKVGDMGIDGRIYPVRALPERTGAEAGELDFMDDYYPVQVKQKDKVGRPEIDAYEAVMMRIKPSKGFIVAFGFTADATAEIGRFFTRSGKVIVPLTVREILDEEIAQKLI